MGVPHSGSSSSRTSPADQQPRPHAPLWISLAEAMAIAVGTIAVVLIAPDDQQLQDVVAVAIGISAVAWVARALLGFRELNPVYSPRVVVALVLLAVVAVILVPFSLPATAFALFVGLMYAGIQAAVAIVAACQRRGHPPSGL